MENFTFEIFRHYDHFVVPFNLGLVVMFSVIGYKYIRWFSRLPREDKILVGKGFFSVATLKATGEVVSESLLHRRIWKINPVLGYMHTSLAFGWFLLIVVGWIEASMHLAGEIVPLHAHVFYKYFAPEEIEKTSRFLSTLMDILLIFVLSGVALAWFKRIKSRTLGMKKTTKHTTGDRIALMSLWFIFPVRLLAESAVSGLKGYSSFLTGNLGAWMVDAFGYGFVSGFNIAMWWVYSLCLAVFFVSMPFSRYMHIFTEIPLIFLRSYKVRSREKKTTFDNFQIEACSRCGICIDPCQLQRDAGINNVQSVYFLRDRRYHTLNEEVVSNCLMCGRCEAKCPVGIELNVLRLNSREKFAEIPADERYKYIKGKDLSSGGGKTGYFAGCMSLLSPGIIGSMQKIFDASGEDIWWADRDGGVCCGRPLKLSGEIEAAKRMMEYNSDLFMEHGITTLVTSCPICLKVFREDYSLPGVEVLHHSEYILRLIQSGLIKPSHDGSVITYHDPCELGRGSGIYKAPREVLSYIGTLKEPDSTGADALCCGSSLANFAINDRQQSQIGAALHGELASTGADTIATSCPLCKKAIARHSTRVRDISEIVASSL